MSSFRLSTRIAVAALTHVIGIYEGVVQNYKKNEGVSVLKPIKKNTALLIIGDGLKPYTLESLKSQIYSDWKIISLKEALKTDFAYGQIVLFPGDGILPPYALYEIAQHLKIIKPDLFYVDEDMIIENRISILGLFNRYLGSGLAFDKPCFKPDWSPDLFRNSDYITNFFGVSLDLLKKITDWGSKYELILKASEITENIAHIPRILFHVKNDISGISETALGGHLVRTNRPGKIKKGLLEKSCQIEYEFAKTSKLSIIIPNKDNVETLRTCISSILKSTYKNIEILVVENHSVHLETFLYYAEISKWPFVKVLKWENKFNYSAVNNFAVTHATGEALLFLNNDIEAISPDWMERMLEYALREDVGCVGAKLYYPDGTIQHAGVIVGLGGLAGHGHVNFKRDADGYCGRLNLSAVTAACLMMRKDVFEEVGGFDEGYPLAFNDVDLCCKIREKDYLIVWTPYAQLYHHESKTRGSDDTPEKLRRFQGEVSLFKEKWTELLLQGDPYYNHNLTLTAENFAVLTWKYDKAKDEYDKKISEEILLEAMSVDAEPLFDYFLDKKASGISASEFLVTSYHKQEATLKAFENNPPAAVWIDPCARLSSLRCYHVYKWLITRGYRYFEAGGAGFLIRRDKYGGLRLSKPDDIAESNKLSKVFSCGELDYLPTRWGKMHDSLFERFACNFDLAGVNDVEMGAAGWAKVGKAHDPYFIWNLSDRLDGGVFDFIRIEFETRPLDDARFRCQFFWASQGEGFYEDCSLTFDVLGRTLFIPLGFYPQWLKSRNIDNIRLDIDNYIGEIKISALTFMSFRGECIEGSGIVSDYKKIKEGFTETEIITRLLQEI